MCHARIIGLRRGVEVEVEDEEVEKGLLVVRLLPNVEGEGELKGLG